MKVLFDDITQELFNLRGEIVSMCNDIIYLQHSLIKIEKQLTKLANEPNEHTKSDLTDIFGMGTKIEKL